MTSIVYDITIIVSSRLLVTEWVGNYTFILSDGLPGSSSTSSTNSLPGSSSTSSTNSLPIKLNSIQVLVFSILVMFWKQDDLI